MKTVSRIRKYFILHDIVTHSYGSYIYRFLVGFSLMLLQLFCTISSTFAEWFAMLPISITFRIYYFWCDVFRLHWIRFELNITLNRFLNLRHDFLIVGLFFDAEDIHLFLRFFFLISQNHNFRWAKGSFK